MFPNVFQHLRSRQSIGIHWGTFTLTSEYIMEPVDRLKKAVHQANLNEECFIVLKHGQTIRYKDLLRDSPRVLEFIDEGDEAKRGEASEITF